MLPLRGPSTAAAKGASGAAASRETASATEQGGLGTLRLELRVLVGLGGAREGQAGEEATEEGHGKRWRMS